MNKKLEPLQSYDKIDNTLCLNNNLCNIEFAIDKDENLDCKNAYEMTECLDNVNQALIELQAIKNSNPSDAMECINRMWDDIEVYNDFRQDFKDLKTIENYILKAQENEKVLNIIKKFFNIKFDDLDWGKLVYIQAKEDDGEYDCTATADLTDYKEDFDALRKWLENDNN